MHTSRKDGLTKKRRKVVVDVISGINPTKSVKRHYKTAHAKQMAHQVMNAPAVKQSIQTALEEAGFTPAERARKLKEIHEATAFDGRPDYKIQLDAEKHVSDLLGDKAPSRSIVGHISEESVLERLKREAAEES